MPKNIGDLKRSLTLCFVFLQRQLSSKEKPAAETQFDLEINSFPPLPNGPVPAVCIDSLFMGLSSFLTAFLLSV